MKMECEGTGVGEGGRVRLLLKWPDVKEKPA